MNFLYFLQDLFLAKPISVLALLDEESLFPKVLLSPAPLSLFFHCHTIKNIFYLESTSRKWYTIYVKNLSLNYPNFLAGLFPCQTVQICWWGTSQRCNCHSWNLSGIGSAQGQVFLGVSSGWELPRGSFLVMLYM